MWKPDCVMVPTALIEAELNGTVPNGTTAACGMMLHYPMTSKETMQSLFPTNSILFGIADAFLRTGKIVTDDGEMIEENLADASPADTGMNLPIEVPPSTSTYDESVIRRALTDTFPDTATPTPKQLRDIQTFSGGNQQFVLDCIALAEQSKNTVKVPGGYVARMLESETPESVSEKLRMNERRVKTNPEAFVNQMLRRAEKELKTLPKPQVTQNSLDSLELLLGELNG